jgi:hypothetical protein
LGWWLPVIIAAVLLPAVLFVAKICLDHQLELRRERRAELAARVDQHLKWVAAGDPRARYGRYPPAHGVWPQGDG